MLLFADETRPVEGRVGRIEFGETGGCTRIRFHLPNFLFFNGAPVRDAPGSFSSQRALLEHGAFRVSIDRAMPFGDQIEKEIARDGGYAITHVGTVERIDGSVFSLNEIDPLLDCLGHYLSFCRGSWTYPVLLCAEDVDGAVVGQRWELSHAIDRSKQTISWFPRNEPVGAQMLQVFRATPTLGSLPSGATRFELLHNGTSKAARAPSRSLSYLRRRLLSCSRGRIWSRTRAPFPKKCGKAGRCHSRQSSVSFWRTA